MPVPTLSPAEAAARLADPDAPLLLDCREPFEFAVCRIPGALLIPLGELAERAPDELDPARPVLVYCHHGVRSVNAVVILSALGFEAAHVRGGIDGWSREVDPSVPRY